MIETRGITLREAAQELIKIANVNNEGSYRLLINDLEEGCKSGILSEKTCNSLKAIIRAEWGKYKHDMIVMSLKPELRELVEAVRHTRVMEHSEDEEIVALSRMYGGPGNESLLIDVAINLGYMKGVRDERKRRKAKLTLKKGEVEVYE